MNCLQAAGYDDLEVIASMDVAEGEKSSCISKIEEFIEKQCLPPQYPSESVNSIPFEFPPGHRVRICNFVHKVKQLYKTPASKGIKSSAMLRKAKPTDQELIQVSLSVDEVTLQVLESIN